MTRPPGLYIFRWDKARLPQRAMGTTEAMRFLYIILALLYALSPYDLVPDFLVGWGWLDDAVILGLVLRFMYQYRKRAKQAAGYTYQQQRAAGGRSQGGRSGQQQRRGTQSARWARSGPFSARQFSWG